MKEQQIIECGVDISNNKDMSCMAYVGLNKVDGKYVIDVKRWVSPDIYKLKLDWLSMVFHYIFSCLDVRSYQYDNILNRMNERFFGDYVKCAAVKGVPMNRHRGATIRKLDSVDVFSVSVMNGMQ